MQTIVLEPDEYQEDILNFKDSDRESLLSYIQSAALLLEKPKESARLMIVVPPLIDTPTRLVNESNEFLEKQLK
jgi:hypothetical protein